MNTTLIYKNESVAGRSRNPEFFIFVLILVVLFCLLPFMFHTTHVVHQAAQSEVAREVCAQLSESVQSQLADLQKQLSAERYKKLLAEVTAILLIKDYRQTELYTLRARVAGWYPILQSTAKGDEIIGEIYLLPGEIWKVGETCCGQKIRYPNVTYFISKDGKTRLNDDNLEFKVEMVGSRTDMLIAEKLWIYGYPFTPEAIARVARGDIFLLIPPGNKIDK